MAHDMGFQGRSLGGAFRTHITDMAAGKFDVFKSFDFTGIAAVVDVMQKESSRPDEKAAAWMNMFATFDPTGWLAAAALFAKPVCKDFLAQFDNDDLLDKSRGSGKGKGSTGGSSGGSSSSGGSRGR